MSSSLPTGGRGPEKYCLLRPIPPDEVETFAVPTIGEKAPEGTPWALVVGTICCNPVLLDARGGTGGEGKRGGS